MAKLKASQAKAIKELLDELDTVRAWMEDTGYPRQSRARFEAVVTTLESEFAVQEDLTPAPWSTAPQCKAKGCKRRTKAESGYCFQHRDMA